MPWAADFAARVHVFRALVATDKLAVRGGDGSAGRPRTASELLITVRRKRVLHDGYAQLAHQPPAALRRVLRVRFVSELGLSEAGIDHNGVFKVATLHSKNFYAHPHAAALHEDAEHLYEFVGRMLGKALYEGVTLDVPLAPFFVRRVLGRASSIDELPELDAQLHSSLTFVRTYTGDVSDLCLSFAIDVERLGAQVSVELRPGGAAIPVDNANRIQYVHLVSDFHLNRQISAQARAVHRGLMGVLHPGWLRLFSAAEVCTLWAGDNVEVDVDDLRRHTDYKGGYHELSPTVRALWQVLRDFSNEERKAFLRFVTSSSGTPLLGFANLEPRFTVQCVSPSGSDNSALGGMLALVGLTPVERQRLPTAATCFNLLKLPDFRSRRVLREKLLLAIQSGSGFELS
ncbi:hypothetical protein T492DRAFT_1056048 [Pavlovales sp. CCMP2436]|nr:hypothetical protein T492DRAFT_1056048 [Pavlovales sp. CCMP2436]